MTQPMTLVELHDAIAKALADSIGHGMREKCEAQADAVVALVAPHFLLDTETVMAAAVVGPICDLFRIGSAARSASTIMANVKNVNRRSECLSAVEREFFTFEVLDDDGEPYEDTELRWGASPAEYVEQFRTALTAITTKAAPKNGRILTCVYCGHEYPQDTPASGDQVLTEHIRTCEKHPMRAMVQHNHILRNALEGLIGASDTDDLQNMEAAIRVLPAPDVDKAVTINAIHALLATAPKPEAA